MEFVWLVLRVSYAAVRCFCIIFISIYVHLESVPYIHLHCPVAILIQTVRLPIGSLETVIMMASEAVRDDSEVEDISAADALTKNSPEECHIAMLKIWDSCLQEGEASAQRQYSLMSDVANASKGVVRKATAEAEAMMLAANDECEALQRRHAKRLKKYQEVHETLKKHVGAVWKE